MGLSNAMMSGACYRILTDRMDELAEAATSRFYARRPEAFTRYGARGRRLCFEDNRYHVRYLAEAVWAGDPALFAGYVAWCKILFTRLKLADILEDGLACFREALVDLAPAEHCAPALACFDAAAADLSRLPDDQPKFLDPQAPHGRMAAAYLSALLQGQRRVASRLVIDAVEEGADVRDIYLRVFEPALQEIGRLWQMNQLSVAQEHYCTASTQLIMSQLYPKIFSAARNHRRMVAACIGGDLHEIGLRMVSDFFELHGWDTYFLGANTPTESILRTIADREAEVLSISVTMPFHLPAARDLIARIRHSAKPASIRVLIGGGAFRWSPGLWQKTGADAYAGNALDAIGAVDGSTFEASGS